MENPKASIIIPVYNGSDYMREAIDSALNQSYKNIEVIIVNDGSQDEGKTEAIARSYRDKVVYVYKENGGVASALNAGIKRMSGDYFSWLSHDDVYYEDKVKRQIEYASQISDTAILYSDYEFIDENSRFIKTHRDLPQDAGAFLCHLVMHYPVHGCTVLIPRICFLVAGLFREDLRTTQDYDLWFRMARVYPFIHLPEILIKSRLHEGQGTRKLLPIVVEECNALYADFITKLNGREIREAGEKSRSLFYLKAASSFRERGYEKASLVAFKYALKFLLINWPHNIFKSALLLNRYTHTTAKMEQALRRILSLRRRIPMVSAGTVVAPAASLLRTAFVASVGLYLRASARHPSAGKPKLLLISDFSDFGGTRTYFGQLVSFYGLHGYRVVAALSEKQLDKEIQELLAGHNFGYERIAGHDTLRDVLALCRIIVRHKPDGIVVSVGNPGLLLHLMLLPLKFLYILHAYPLKQERSFLNRWILGRCTSGQKVILTVSRYSRDRIIDYWFGNKDQANVVYIHNSPGPELEEGEEAFDGRKRVLTLGHVTGYKNPQLWIRVAKRVLEKVDHPQQVEFVWAGDGVLFDECRLMASDCPNIRFFGYRKDTAELYRRASIYFQPSSIESFGLSVADAMRHGIPCVVSNCGALPELVGDGAGLVDAVGDEESFSDKIISLLKDSALRKQMGAAGRLLYVTRFSSEIWESRMIDLHRQIGFGDNEGSQVRGRHEGIAGREH
jgi:glycosyltransferase involved in cell wall biosynthesis